MPGNRATTQQDTLVRNRVNQLFECSEDTLPLIPHVPTVLDRPRSFTDAVLAAAETVTSCPLERRGGMELTTANAPWCSPASSNYGSSPASRATPRTQIGDLAEGLHGDRRAMFFGAPAPDRR
jgi:hypothetical protein